MEDYNISDTEITASSFQGGYSPQNARLHNKSAWVPSKMDTYEWIQVRFLRQVPITGVTTQGEQGANAWVKTYGVRYSLDNQDWNHVRDEYGEVEVSFYRSRRMNRLSLRHLEAMSYRQ